MENPRFSFMVVVLLALVLAACGDSGDSTATTADTPPPPPPAEALEGEGSDEACTIVMGWDPWEPYHFQDVDGSVRGLDVEIVTAVTERAGCSLQFYRDDWTNLLRMLQTGEISLLSGATRTPERTRYADFSPAYREEAVQLFVRAGETSRFEADDLETLLRDGFRLGVTLGYVYGPEVARLQSEFDPLFRVANVSEANVGNLLDQRIDGFLEDPYVAAAAQRRRGWEDEVDAHPLTIYVGDVHLMFSQAGLDQATTSRINDSLQAMLDEGEVEAITERYLN